MKIHERVAQLRERAGLSLRKAAKLAGWEQASSWHYWERDLASSRDFIPLEVTKKLASALVGLGDPPITRAEVMALADVAAFDSVRHLSPLAEVETALVAEAGAWRECVDLPIEDRAKLPIPSDLGIDPRYLFGVEVRGQSMDLVYPHGSKVICATLDAVEPQSGDDVVARRSRSGLYEMTIKRFVILKGGKRALLPQSSRPEHQEPILLDEPRTDEVEIVGVVVAEFRIRPRPKAKTTRR